MLRVEAKPEDIRWEKDVMKVGLRELQLLERARNIHGDEMWANTMGRIACMRLLFHRQAYGTRYTYHWAAVTLAAFESISQGLEEIEQNPELSQHFTKGILEQMREFGLIVDQKAGQF